MNKYTFDDIFIGQTEYFSVVITQDMLEQFKKITGDLNPLHNDKEFAVKQGYSEKVVYGMLSASFLSTLAGVYLPGEKSLIQSVEVKFIKPVFINDELKIRGILVDKNETVKQVVLKVEIINQDDIKVLRGKMKVGFTE